MYIKSFTAGGIDQQKVARDMFAQFALEFQLLPRWAWTFPFCSPANYD